MEVQAGEGMVREGCVVKPARPAISCLGNYAYSSAVSLMAWASNGHGLVYLVSHAAAAHRVHQRGPD